MDWIVRAEVESDHIAIDRLHQSAFGQDGESRLVRALRCLPDFAPELSLVADAKQRIIGHILFTSIRIRGPTRSVPALALAPMAVLPQWQRRGVGSSLMQIGLDCCRRLGHTRVIVVGHSRYYGRFGFVSASRFGIQAPFPVSPDAFMALALQVHALSGCPGVVEYPAAFAAG